MKKIMIIMVALFVTVAASAQRGHGGARVVVVSPSIGYGYYPYSSFYYSPYGLYPFGYPYGYYNNYRNTSKLERQVEDIKNDYSDKIKSAKRDKSLSKEERKKIVSQLKEDRDKEVHDLKANYYKRPKQAPAATPSQAPAAPSANG
ncbi:MAG: hypothetical protein QM726_09520 [Chitinophagaceae bacterium]